MKIYFAGSIRGGGEDRESYLKIINHLKKYGSVLTEHVGDQELIIMEEINLPNEEIYNRDFQWITEADVVIAEVSTPSLGVGYELAIAEKLGKKILCLYGIREGKTLSSMIAGNKNMIVKEYKNQEEAFQFIDDFFNNLNS